jgi:hypothetical protein
MRYTLILTALLLATGCSSMRGDTPTAIETEYETEPTSDLCGNSEEIGGGSFSLSFTPYPCEVFRSYSAIDRTYERKGWEGWMPRVLIRARLLSKGAFAFVFGFVGLG